MARNGSGSYNPPAGNPVAVGTTIQSAWANTTIADLGAELTNSLPRDGQASMLAPLKITDGSSTIPSLSFNSESGTGIYRPGVGQLAISNNGVTALTTNAGNVTIAGGLTASGTSVFNGNVGIGNPAPSSILDIGTTSASSTYVKVTNTSAGPAGIASGFLSASSGGNIILGTYGSGATTSGLAAPNRARLTASSGIDALVVDTSSATAPLIFGTQSLERMRIDSAGNVGIGVSPSYPLDLGTALQNKMLRVGGVLIGNAGSGYPTVGYNAKQTNSNAWSYDGTDVATWMQFSNNVIFYRAASGTGGTAITPLESMRIDSSGNVGVGTNNPTSKFQIQLTGTNPINGATIAKTTDFAAAARFGFNGLATNNDGVFFGMGADGTGIPAGVGFMREGTGWNTALAFYTNNVTSGPNGTTAMQEKMRIDSAGNVGIGITPTAKLHVSSAGTVANLVSATGEAYLKLTAPSATGGFIGYGVGSTESMTFLTNNAERMRIDAGGNLSIGTPTASYKFHVNGTGATIAGVEGTTDASFITKVNGSQALYLHSTTALSEINELRALPLVFTVNGNERMRIDSGGNVGVGGTAPSNGRTLAVQNSSTGAATFYLQNSTTGYANTNGVMLQLAGTDGYFWNNGGGNLVLGTNGAERARIDATGQVGVGLTPVLSGNNRGLLQLQGSANGGIYLGNTANAATNVLDHYEEGTFTFVPVGLSTAGAPSGTTINGNFIRVGKLVHITGTASWTSHSGTGALQMSGLPYAAANVMPIAMTVQLIGPTYTGIPHAEIQIGTSNIRINQQASGGGGTYLNVPSGSTTININGSYFVA